MESKSDLWKFLQPIDFVWLGAIAIAYVVSSILLLLYSPLIFVLGIVFPIAFTVGGTYGISLLLRHLTVKETYYIQCNSCHYALKVRKHAYNTGEACPVCMNGTITKSIVRERPVPKKCAGCGSRKDLVRISGVYVCKKCRGEMIGK